MKVVLFFFMIIVSFSSLSKPVVTEKEIKSLVTELKEVNGKLLQVDGDPEINQLLEKKLGILARLMAQLKRAGNLKLPVEISKNKLIFLQSRIQVNSERGNLLAAQRDHVKLQEHLSNQAISSYLQYLIEASKSYESIEDIVFKTKKSLDESVLIENKVELPKAVVEGKIFLELEQNYRNFIRTSDSYQDILTYVNNNPRSIASLSWFQEFSLLSAISYVNQFDFVQPINNKLAPFVIDVGGVVLSMVIFLLIFYSYPLVFKCTSWCIENYVLDEGAEHQELIYHEIRKPVQMLLICFGVNLGTYAFFYKTDYQPSLENIFFIVYSLLIIWLLFKIVNSIVLVQIDKLSNSNKGLRKGLFNLGVQSAKGLIVVFVLAVVFNHFGISLTAIVSTLGVGGLAFALAAKDTLSNLFGGITILFDNVFRMGDWVTMGDVEGTVVEIGLRSTTIRTFDNALITIPNALVSVSSVKNWNRRAIGRRIKMYVGVTYESDMNDVRQGIDDIRTMLQSHPGIANPKQKHANKRKNFKFSSHEDTQGIKSTQLVFMDKYSDFSIDILIYCFARTVSWAEWLAVKEDVLFKIADILEKNNLEFAYPTQVRIHRSEEKMRADSQNL